MSTNSQIAAHALSLAEAKIGRVEDAAVEVWVDREGDEHLLVTLKFTALPDPQVLAPLTSEVGIALNSWLGDRGDNRFATVRYLQLEAAI